MVVAPSTSVESLCINSIRFLAVDAINKSNSGHPGLPMGCAPMAYSLWDKVLRHNPKNPKWFNRDRFVLSAGHGCMLLYALLHLSGYDSVTIEDIKQFRQWGSRTPGHPETFETPGVEVTTGPLGQGISNAVGLAIAEAHLAAKFNRPGATLVDHYTYVLMGDGCNQEGVSSEAASLAGHLGLGKLIALYDDNHITIDGNTAVSFTEDVLKRYEAYGWHVQHVADGNTDVDAITKAIEAAKAVTDKPSLIKVTTTIGYGSPNKANTAGVHGAALGADEAELTRKALDWSYGAFEVPTEAYDHWRQAIGRGAAAEAAWDATLADYRSQYPSEAAEFERLLRGELPQGWDANLPSFTPEDKGLATRQHSYNALNAFGPSLPELIGGSADLTHSNLTDIKGEASFQKGAEANRYLHFGVREHAMAAILNGIAYHGSGLIPYGGTFLVFAGYMIGAMRLSALSELGVIYVLTHDSIGLGEDGPTHQPVETLANLRAIPNLLVMRPGDGNETVGGQGWLHPRRFQRQPRSDPDRHRHRARPLRQGRRPAARRRPQRARGLDALRRAVRGTGSRLPRIRPAEQRAQARRGRSLRFLRLAQVLRLRRRHHLDRSLRCLRSRAPVPGEVRLHRGERRGDGERAGVRVASFRDH